MAYITITGDSDGDLHNADMHNSKFGAIASVINGNIDLENLTNPKSNGIIRLNYNGFYDSTLHGKNYFYQLTGPTAGNINSMGWLNSAGADNVIKTSWFKIPFSIRITSAKVIYSTSTFGTSGEDYNIYLQVSSTTTITDSYSTIATFTNDFNGGISVNEEDLTISDGAVGADKYIRVVVSNPTPTFTSTNPPPGFQLNIHYKTDHTS